MAHGRQFRRGAIVSSRRKTSWSAGPQQIPTNLSAAGATLWALGSQALEDGLTAVRIRGEGSLLQVTTTTVLDGFANVGLGICNVSENAFNAGVASVPTPLTDIGWDGWMWHMLLSEFVGMSTTETGQAGSEYVRFPIETKAMRKTRASDVLVGVVELGTEVGAAVLRFQATSRVLDKLS